MALDLVFALVFSPTLLVPVLARVFSPILLVQLLVVPLTFWELTEVMVICLIICFLGPFLVPFQVEVVYPQAYLFLI